MAHVGFGVKALEGKVQMVTNALTHRSFDTITQGVKPMMNFPIAELLDEQRCYDFLLSVLHPEGLHCRNGHPLPPDQAPHDRHRDPIFVYRCRVCGNVFNIFTDTIWSESRYSCPVLVIQDKCVTIVLIMRGIIQGVPTNHLAAELGIDRSHLLKRRHEIQKLAQDHLPRTVLYGQYRVHP